MNTKLLVVNRDNSIELLEPTKYEGGELISLFPGSSNEAQAARLILAVEYDSDQDFTNIEVVKCRGRVSLEADSRLGCFAD